MPKWRTAEIRRIATIENENWKDQASKLIYMKGQIWESAKSNLGK